MREVTGDEVMKVYRRYPTIGWFNPTPREMPDLYALDETLPNLMVSSIKYRIRLTVYHFPEYDNHRRLEYRYHSNSRLEINSDGLSFRVERPSYLAVDDYGDHYGTANDVEQIKVIIANAWRAIKGI